MHISSNIRPTENLVNPLNFTNVSTLQDLNTNKPYAPIAGCVLEHILYNNQFSNIEKLNYILSDSIAPINYSRDAQRTSTLSAKQWGKILNCSKTKAFAAQKNLEEKGYFVIQRSTNKQGRNKNNIITPTLPNQVFAALSKTPEKWGSKVTSYTPSDNSKRVLSHL
ncbi:MAG: hypothetical protein QMO91_06580 [Candidatus Tisiphia sp.]|nr:hypothetical protein [Candidatus Tisiphia sp.]